MLRRSIWVALAVVTALWLAAACTGEKADRSASCTPAPSASVAIEVDQPVALADQPVHLTVSGLDPGGSVTVRAEATDRQGEVWRADATFVADGDGMLDLDRDAPQSGSYQGVDGMGLFWSMDPPTGDPDESWFITGPPETVPSFEVEVAVCPGADEVARTTLSREWVTGGVTHHPLELDRDGVVGDLYLPAETGPRTGVLLLGGSGGSRPTHDAALLASHGHPALALSYFRAPGLPDEIRDIPLEYFVEAAELLAARPEVGPSSVAVVGSSRGGEPALLLAQLYPELVRGAVVYSGSNYVVGGFPSGGYAWTLAGEGVLRSAIPLDTVAGPILAVAGGEDPSFWPADTYAEGIVAQCESAEVGYACDSLIYPAAGHFVGSFPFRPSGTGSVHPVTGERTDWGGTREANEAARRDGWPKVLDFLANVSPDDARG